jgi:hypothetical protein
MDVIFYEKKEKKMIIKQTTVVPNYLGKPDWGYLEMETGRKFRRIYGGMQWPASNPGAVVVVAEDLEMDPALDERKLWILDEYENRNPSELIGRCSEFKGLMQIEKFYGDTTNRPMMTFLRSTKANFSLKIAPFVDQPTAHEAYLSLIREKTSVTKKVLAFGDKSALPAKLSSIADSLPTGDSFKTDFPQIAALGYALSALVVLQPEKPMPWVPSYEPLDPEVGY